MLSCESFLKVQDVSVDMLHQFDKVKTQDVGNTYGLYPLSPLCKIVILKIIPQIIINKYKPLKNHKLSIAPVPIRYPM